MPEKAAEVYFLIGKCHVESGNYSAALDALNSAIRINPNYAEVRRCCVCGVCVCVCVRVWCSSVERE